MRLIDQCLRLHEELCPAEMLPFHESESSHLLPLVSPYLWGHSALVRFFRKNFHDEIQRLSSSNPSETNLPINPAGHTTANSFPRPVTITTTANTYDGASSTYPRDGASYSYPKRSESSAARPSFSTTAPKRSHLPTPSVSLSIPLSLSASLRERISSPTDRAPPPPPLKRFEHAKAGTGAQQLTPLQQNIAHLTKYGLSSPGEGTRAGDYNGIGGGHVSPTSPETASNGSLVNVSAGLPGKTHSIRDNSSVFSNRTKERLSRLCSLGWIKRDQ